jgi:hypothetical protein
MLIAMNRLFRNLALRSPDLPPTTQAAEGLAALAPKTALLAVEVADSSLRWDLGRKALIQSHFGIPELWVIDAATETTHVHTAPGLEGYGSIRQVPADAEVRSMAVPGLSVTLAALERFLGAFRWRGRMVPCVGGGSSGWRGASFEARCAGTSGSRTVCAASLQHPALTAVLELLERGEPST